MPVINPVTPENAGAAQDALNGLQQKLGTVPNIYATMAQAPAALNGFLAFSEALASGVISAAVREQIALTVAGRNSCDYCASAHTLLATLNGVAKDEAAQNLNGVATDAKTQAILTFAAAVVEQRGNLTESQIADLRNAGVSDQELVEIIAIVAANIFTNYFNHIAKTEIDFPVVSAAA